MAPFSLHILFKSDNLKNFHYNMRSIYVSKHGIYKNKLCLNMWSTKQVISSKANKGESSQFVTYLKVGMLSNLGGIGPEKRLFSIFLLNKGTILERN